MIHLEKALTTSNNLLPFAWFMNQDHIPFDIPSLGTYLDLYHEFLKELYQLYLKTNSEYYWFTKHGKLIHDEGDLVKSNYIKINKQKLRDLKLEQLLNIN